MNSSSSDGSGRDRGSDAFNPTRRTVLAAGGTVALTGLAGCAALDGLMDRAGEQVVGTTASAPAAFYLGRPASASSASLSGAQMPADLQFLSTAATTDSHAESDEPQVFRTGSGDVRQVPATARAEGQAIDLEGWATSGDTKAQDYNASRSNKPSRKSEAQDYNSSRSNKFEWWVGPDDEDDDDEDGDVLVGILNVELDLVASVAIARDAVERRKQAEAKRALDAFIDATENALRPALDKCGTGVCETIRENSDIRVEGVRRASDAVDEENWTVALREVAGVDEVVLGDIERLDDELVERRPGRPKFADIIRYMRDDPTIGERFTVCLPDAKLPGDRGSLAGELTPGRVLSYVAASHEEGGRHTPFHNRYRPQGIEYDDDGCVQMDGPVSLHREIACQELLSATLDTYRTANRAIVGYSTEDGAVVSGAPASADTDGKCVFVAADGTLREPTSLDSWPPVTLDPDSDDDGLLASVSQTLVCPVAVTPADCPCPLPGLFFVRRLIHDDQVIFAGGWILDEGALYDDSVTLLFEEGPTEVARMTAEDVESGNIDDRIVEQFSRGRSEHGSSVGSGQGQIAGMNKPELIESIAAASGYSPKAFQTDEGRKGLNAVNVKVMGKPSDDGDEGAGYLSTTALDAPLVHLAGARELSDDAKLEAAGRIETGVINSGEEVDILGME